MVFNRSRVIPARLRGTETRSGSTVEVLLVRRLEPGIWQALGRPVVVCAPAPKWSSLRTRPTPFALMASASRYWKLTRTACAPCACPTRPVWDNLGELPLPPYIKETPDDPERYQTCTPTRPAASPRPPPASTLPMPCWTHSCPRCAYGVGHPTRRPRHLPPGAWRGHRRAQNPYRVVRPAAGHRRRHQPRRRDGNRIIAVGTTTVRTWNTLHVIPTATSPQPRATPTFSSPPAINSAWWTPCSPTSTCRAPPC